MVGRDKLFLKSKFLPDEGAHYLHRAERCASFIFHCRLTWVAKFNRVFVEFLPKVPLQLKSWIIWQAKLQQFNQIVHLAKGLIVLLQICFSVFLSALLAMKANRVIIWQLSYARLSLCRLIIAFGLVYPFLRQGVHILLSPSQ